jgi:hypothetical protein
MLRMLMVISSDDKQQEGLLRSFDSHHLHDDRGYAAISRCTLSRIDIKIIFSEVYPNTMITY